MGPGIYAICHGLAPCRTCQLPVAAPAGLLERQLFHLSRCPHCHVLNPHPQQVEESAHTRKTAKLGALILVASVALVLLGPMEIVLGQLSAYV